MVLVFITVYALVAAVSLLGLTLLAQLDVANRLFFRVLTGERLGQYLHFYFKVGLPFYHILKRV